MQTRRLDLDLILDLRLGGGANHIRAAFLGHGPCEIIVLRGQTQAAYGGCATSIKSQHLPPVRALLMTTYSVFRLAARGRRPVLATFKAGIGAGERKTLLR